MTQTERIGRIVYEGKVQPDWIDANGHMNVAYYVLAFDFGTDALWADFGITNEYIETVRGSTFAVDCHVTYQREMLENHRYIVTTQILAYDEKRIHQFQRMYHAEKGYLAATAEWLNLYIDLNERRVSAWPEHILTNIRDIAYSQEGGLRPAEAGKQMSITKPLYRLFESESV